MATVNTGSIHTVTEPAVGQFQANHQLQGNSWSSGIGDVTLNSQWGISSVTENESEDGSGGSSGSWTRNTGPSLTADENYQFRAKVNDSTGDNFGTTKNGKTAAMAASASSPSSSAITSFSATIACDFTPRTLRSSCSAQLQYKKSTDVSWTNAGSPDTSGGYSNVNVSRNITGLQAATVYNVRLVVTRSTINDTSLTGPVSNFTTLEGIPVVTTDVAIDVTPTSATLKGTLDINEGTGVNVYFKWDTVFPPVANQTANQSMTADGAFEQSISGLGINTYFYQAFASFSSPAGSPVSGSIRSFIAAKAGSIWIDGTALHIIAGSFQQYAVVGTLIGAAAGQIGSIWIEGDNLNYIDASGNERSISGSDLGIQTAKIGSLWQEATFLAWIDASQHKRLSVGVLV